MAPHVARQMQVTGALARHWNAVDVQGADDAPSRPAANKPESVGRAALRCSLCPACAPLAPGAALLGTALSWRGIVPFTHLARHPRTAGIAGRTWRRGGVAARGARAADAQSLSYRFFGTAPRREHFKVH